MVAVIADVPPALYPHAVRVQVVHLSVDLHPFGFQEGFRSQIIVIILAAELHKAVHLFGPDLLPVLAQQVAVRRDGILEHLPVRADVPGLLHPAVAEHLSGAAVVIENALILHPALRQSSAAVPDGLRGAEIVICAVDLMAAHTDNAGLRIKIIEFPAHLPQAGKHAADGAGGAGFPEIAETFGCRLPARLQHAQFIEQIREAADLLQTGQRLALSFLVDGVIPDRRSLFHPALFAGGECRRAEKQSQKGTDQKNPAETLHFHYFCSCCGAG